MIFETSCSKYELVIRCSNNNTKPVVIRAMGFFSESGQYLGSWGRVTEKVLEPVMLKPNRRTPPSRMRESICGLLNALLPSLLTLKTPERLHSILRFMEEFVESEEQVNTLSRVEALAKGGLTPLEVALCAMIRTGMTSDQLAETFGVTPKTIAFRRAQIRKKLGLKDRRQRLASFLQGMSTHVSDSHIEEFGLDCRE